MTSTVFEVQSGTAQARDVQFRTGLPTLSSLTLRMEPLGSTRLPAVKLLNARVAKKFDLRPGPHRHGRVGSVQRAQLERGDQHHPAVRARTSTGSTRFCLRA